MPALGAGNSGREVVSMRIVYFGATRSLVGFILSALVLATSVGIVTYTAGARLITAVVGKRIIPIYEVPTSEKKVALTFDISWGHVTAPPVLDILKQEKVRSTFFISGPWAQNHPDIARRIADDGHEIASHGWRHINYTSIRPDEIQQEVSKAEEAIRTVTGKTTKMIRTPNGDYDSTVVTTLRGMGYEVIQWSTDSLDWMNPGVGNIVGRILRLAHPGDIILMHASDSCKQTVEALPAVIRGLREKGLELVTVSELLRLGEPRREIPALRFGPLAVETSRDEGF